MCISLMGKAADGDRSSTVFYTGTWSKRLNVLKRFLGKGFLSLWTPLSFQGKNFCFHSETSKLFFSRATFQPEFDLASESFCSFLFEEIMAQRSKSLHDLCAGSRLMCKAVQSLFFILYGDFVRVVLMTFTAPFPCFFSLSEKIKCYSKMIDFFSDGHVWLSNDDVKELVKSLFFYHYLLPTVVSYITG